MRVVDIQPYQYRPEPKTTSQESRDTFLSDADSDDQEEHSDGHTDEPGLTTWNGENQFSPYPFHISSLLFFHFVLSILLFFLPDLFIYSYWYFMFGQSFTNLFLPFCSRYRPTCGHCVPMKTQRECICCQSPAVSRTQMWAATQPEVFLANCLNRWV